MSDVAVAYETDWTVGAWLIWGAVALIAVLILWFGPVLIPLVVQGIRNQVVGVGLIALLIGASVFVVFGLPFTMSRHIPALGDTWIVLVPAAVIGAALLIRSFVIDAYEYHLTRWVPRVGGISLLTGAGVGLAGDTLTRMAAAIPMSVTGLVGILIVGVVVVVMYAASDR